ncbi:ABC transporter substrate-binding protein [Candidatus Epulonipiscioides gigas]|nr:ABC transporter substrate-binding protein [Epulopiscium sp. SCG-C07WGA-EpuloA2]ONI44840.1 ABC transporter substrate-binding protein [Epulopiscium sp. SCG-C07WGA-EpuloA2]
MKKFLSVVLSSTMLIAFAGCTSSETNTSTDTSNLVGVSMPTQDLQRWNQDGENMKAQLESAGYDVDLQYAANDIATQVSQIENMISGGVKTLVVASIDGSALGTVMEQAKSNGIEVIAYDRLIMGTDAISYYSTFDNWDVGVKQGEYIVDKLKLDSTDETYTIEFITGDPGDNNINFFFGGAMSILQPYLDEGTLECLSGQTEQTEVATVNWATDVAQARFENILASYYTDTDLDIVLASNDSTAQGVTNALVSSYDGAYPLLTGQDCDVVSVQNIISGKQEMSIFKDTRDLAAKTVEMVDALMKGSEPPINDNKTYDNGTGIIPSYLCEPVVATLNNYEALLIETGYYTAEEVQP